MQQLLGDDMVRTVAMASTDGLRRGVDAQDTGRPIAVPVGESVLGRVLDVLGNPVDEQGPIEDPEDYWPIHRPSPRFEDLATQAEQFVTGIKVIDLLCPVRRGGKVGLFGGAGVGKTVDHSGAHQQHRPAVRGHERLRRRRRANARGQRPLRRVRGGRASSGTSGSSSAR